MTENKKFASTIVIPELFHVNFLAVALAGLVRNSRLRHRIIVAFSDPMRRPAGRTDFEDISTAYISHPETSEQYIKYKNIYDYIKRRGEWCKKHDIEFLDVTEEIVEFQNLWLRDNPFKGSPMHKKFISKGGENTGSKYEEFFRYKGGTDAGFKRNMAFRLVDTEWVTLVWDDDFYPSRGWDVSLFELAEKHKNEKAVYVPTHVQMFHFDPLPKWKNYWVESRRGFPSSHSVRLAIPTTRKGEKCHVTNEEWDTFVNRWSKKEVLSEPCALRNLIGWLPLFSQTKHLKNIGPSIYPSNYKGVGAGPWSLHGTGGDIELDDRFHREGFIKYSPCDSFVLHRGHIAFKPEEV